MVARRYEIYLDLSSSIQNDQFLTVLDTRNEHTMVLTEWVFLI